MFLISKFINKLQSDNEIISEIRQLFYQYKLKQCIQKADQFKNLKQQFDFTVYQTVELYKCQSYFSLRNVNKGKECIEQLIKLSNEKKEDKVDEIDVIIQAYYQMQIVDSDQQEAIQQNNTLLNYTLKYKQQNEKDTNYNKGVYLLGLGIYNFIEQLDQKDQEMECIDQLQYSYNTVGSFKQEIGYILGCVLFYLYKFDELFPFCKSLYEINPKFPGIAGFMTLCCEKQNQPEEAQKYYKLALQLCPENFVVIINSSNFYRQHQQKEKELECLKEAYKINPKSGLICLCYGRYLFQNNEQEKGLNILEDGMKSDPTYQNLFSLFANIQFQKYNIAYGLNILEEFINKNPNNLNGIFEVIQKLTSQQLFDRAIEYIQQYLNINKKDSIQSQTVKYFKAQCQYNRQFEEESLLELLNLLNSSKIQISIPGLKQNINFLINNTKKLSQKWLVQIISELFGPIQMRLNILIEDKKERLRPDKQLILKQKQDMFREIAQILAYQNQIQQHLSFKNSISHWDLFID